MRNCLSSSLSWGATAALLLFNLPTLIHAAHDDDDENAGVGTVGDIFLLICGIFFFFFGAFPTCEAVLIITGLALLACFGEDVTSDWLNDLPPVEVRYQGAPTCYKIFISYTVQGRNFRHVYEVEEGTVNDEHGAIHQTLVLRVLPFCPSFAVPKDECGISMVRAILGFIIFGAPSMVMGVFAMTGSLSDLLRLSMGRALEMVVLLWTPVTLWVLYVQYRQIFLTGSNNPEISPTKSERNCSTLDDPSSSVPLNSELADVGEAEQEKDIGEHPPLLWQP
jgi:hypothetical protein